MVNLIVIMLALLAVTGCAAQRADSDRDSRSDRASTTGALEGITGALSSTGASEFTLETAIVDGRMAVIGRGGAIDNVVNPDLHVEAGSTLLITLVNKDGIPHDLSIPDVGAKTSLVSGKGQIAELSLVLDEDRAGTFDYFCTVSGHRQAGMAGRLIVHSMTERLSSAGG